MIVTCRQGQDLLLPMKLYKNTNQVTAPETHSITHETQVEVEGQKRRRLNKTPGHGNKAYYRSNSFLDFDL